MMTTSIKPGDTVVLLHDVVRKVSKENKVYGKAGDPVKVISVTGDVLIVEGKERFALGLNQVNSPAQTAKNFYNQFGDVMSQLANE